MNLPDAWDGAKRGEHPLAHADSGLAHSSPIVWGDRVFVTTAVSSRPNATFRPGLYGDGGRLGRSLAAAVIIYALDRRSGTILWQRVAVEGAPHNLRHIKSTYASATPATDGRIVVASFGSEGLHAFDVNGNFLWKVDSGRSTSAPTTFPRTSGDRRARRSSGTASSSCRSTRRRLVPAGAEGRHRRDVLEDAREELPSWGTPTVATRRRARSS
jgi:outer membrane protein assembly factor BamB